MKKLIGSALFILLIGMTNANAQRSDASLPECEYDQGEQLCSSLFRQLNRLQKKGSAEAANLLALFYMSGEYGLAKDTDKAVSMLKKAARKRSAIAQYELAKLYFVGEHVEQDREKALTLMKKASQQGYDDATATYNFILLQQATDVQEKAEYLAAINALEVGYHNNADYFLGKYFKHIDDHEQAQKFLGMAAKRGNVKARSMIAQNYPQMKEEKPDLFDDEYERVLVIGATPDVNAAAREIIAFAKSNSTFSGKSTGSKVPGRSCMYDQTCSVLTRNSHINQIYRTFNALY